MVISQALLDRVGAIGVRMQGSRMETVTYTHKASSTAMPVVLAVYMLLESYRQHDIDMELILPNDQRGRLMTTSIAFTPTRFDQFVRADGNAWRVMYATGGPGDLWWFLQCRQVG